MFHLSRCLKNIFAILFLASVLGAAHAGTKQHQDLQTHTVAGSILPPVFGGSWTVDSRINVLSAEPHLIPIGSTADFQFREFYNLGASSFTPLLVPGTPNVPPTMAGDPLDSKTWTFTIRNEGCAEFDYSTPWTFNIDPNQGHDKTPEFTLGLEKGPISFEVKWGGGSVPATNFIFTPLPNVLSIEFATSDLGQGFFRNGGSLSARGTLKATQLGMGRVFAENDHFATGEGILVDDYTWALPDAAGNPANVRTSVFDTYSCVPVPEPCRQDDVACVPEPSALALFGVSGLSMLGYARRRRKKAA